MNRPPGCTSSPVIRSEGWRSRTRGGDYVSLILAIMSYNLVCRLVDCDVNVRARGLSTTWEDDYIKGRPEI